MSAIGGPVHGVNLREMSLEGLFCLHHGPTDGLLLGFGDL